MEHETQMVVVKKENRFWKVVKVLLVVGAACFVAVKVYNKFFRKKKELLCAEDADDADALAAAEESEPAEEPVAQEAVFEAPAEAVLESAEEDSAR